ncbi:MAG: tetratricopeptide repeat protein, partial [Myxococcales bacterium]|nr:tetratricopeptide repeat protein [Myxococcales bacterium]
KPEDTEPFARRARAVITRMGEPSDLAGDLHEVLGARSYVLGNWPDALEHAEQELELRVAAFGEGTLQSAEARARLAAVLTNLDRGEEAEIHLEQALSDAEVWLGVGHPRLAGMLNAHGLNQKSRGQYAEAHRTHLRALDILERALGPDNPALEPALTNLGNASMHLGLLQEAEQHHRRAIRLKEKLYGDEHPQVALGLNNLANVMIQSKRWDEAVELHQRALSIRERSLQKGDRMIGMSLTNLGDALAGAGRHAEAIEQYQLSVENLEQALGPDHSWLAYPLTGLANAYLLEKKPDLAVAPAERALSIRDKPGLAEDLAAETRFTLARALFEAGKDKTRALSLAKEARTVFVAAGEPKKQYLAELDEWLANVERKTLGATASGLQTSLGGGGLGRK